MRANPARGLGASTDLNGSAADQLGARWQLRARAGKSIVPFRILVELPELPMVKGEAAELQRSF